MMGPPGSGKSTFLHCAAGLDRPSSRPRTSSAAPELAGMNETDADRAAPRTAIGFVFQAFNLRPALTVEQNVTLPLQPGRRSAGPGVARAQIAVQVGLDERRNGPPPRAAVRRPAAARSRSRRALVTRPERRCSADEPTGALDTPHRRATCWPCFGEIVGRPRPDGDHGHPRPGRRVLRRRACCSWPTAGSCTP